MSYPVLKHNDTGLLRETASEEPTRSRNVCGRSYCVQRGT